MIDSLAPEFDVLALSGPGWPVHVAAAMAGGRARRRWPDLPAAATPGGGRMGHGRGADAAAAARSALGEMIETASCCAWGDEDCVEASAAEIGAAGWPPALLDGFSPGQRRRRAAWNRRLEGLDRIPPALPPGRPIAWLEARDALSGGTVWLPADAVLMGRSAPDGPAAAAPADSNGCACGETPEAALRAALLELIERDATGLWWYGRRPCARLDPAAAPLAEQAGRHLRGRGRTLRLLDITSDIGVPTAAALALRGNRLEAAGFASRPVMADAAEAAVQELMQMALKACASGEEPPGAPLGAASADPARDARASAPDLRGAADAAALLRRLAARGCRVAVLDRTRPEFGVPVVRAVSPELCHWKPRLGRPRLLEGAAAHRLNPNLLRV